MSNLQDCCDGRTDARRRRPILSGGWIELPVEYWSASSSSKRENLQGAVVNFADISERKRAEQARQLLLRELNHRVKISLRLLVE